MATHRMFPHDPPKITFTKDYRQLVHGNLQPGRPVTIVYDAERLPNERSQANGRKAWTIRCFHKFLEQGQVSSIDMWSETGEIQTKITDEVGEGTMMLCRIEVPHDADHLTLWFLNTGTSGAEYWDSNFGRNYIFRFVVEDLEIVSVGVERSSTTRKERFQIEVQASSAVEDVAVLYRIMNDPAAPKDKDMRLELKTDLPISVSEKRKWSGSAPVPADAVVRFTVTYLSYGNAHADTNSGKGYLTWAGAQRNREAGVL